MALGDRGEEGLTGKALGKDPTGSVRLALRVEAQADGIETRAHTGSGESLAYLKLNAVFLSGTLVPVFEDAVVVAATFDGAAEPGRDGAAQ
ncbi:hypothetical protein [Leifsonia sp. Leaf336]|uniref:hypothetical protein n=1 Tax=Leifsonia sp. Leaf336 TaxID=1736341 RepID=UPI0012FCCB9D|nr:hypothetical protein [Leifsonia sp. Leaf336]